MANFSDFNVGTTVYECRKCGNIERSNGECSNCGNDTWNSHTVTYENCGYDENGNNKN